MEVVATTIMAEKDAERAMAQEKNDTSPLTDISVKALRETVDQIWKKDGCFVPPGWYAERDAENDTADSNETACREIQAMLHTAEQRADRSEAELSAIDSLLARRSALDGCATRAERVQRCIDAAAVTDPTALTAKLIEANMDIQKLDRALDAEREAHNQTRGLVTELSERCLRLEVALSRENEANDKIKSELEEERLRLAACGIVAIANTLESSAKARNIALKYHGASCDDTANAVDREMFHRDRADRCESILRGLRNVIDERIVAHSRNTWGDASLDMLIAYKYVIKKLDELEVQK